MDMESLRKAQQWEELDIWTYLGGKEPEEEETAFSTPHDL